MLDLDEIQIKMTSVLRDGALFEQAKLYAFEYLKPCASDGWSSFCICRRALSAGP